MARLTPAQQARYIELEKTERKRLSTRECLHTLYKEREEAIVEKMQDANSQHTGPLDEAQLIGDYTEQLEDAKRYLEAKIHRRQRRKKRAVEKKYGLTMGKLSWRFGKCKPPPIHVHTRTPLPLSLPPPLFLSPLSLSLSFFLSPAVLSYHGPCLCQHLEGAITRPEAEQLCDIVGNQDGTFLIRENQGANNGGIVLVLTVVYKGRPTHHALKKSERFWVINGAAFGEYEELEDLIEFLSEPGVHPKWPIALFFPMINDGTHGPSVKQFAAYKARRIKEVGFGILGTPKGTPPDETDSDTSSEDASSSSGEESGGSGSDPFSTDDDDFTTIHPKVVTKYDRKFSKKLEQAGNAEKMEIFLKRRAHTNHTPSQQREADVKIEAPTLTKASTSANPEIGADAGSKKAPSGLEPTKRNLQKPGNTDLNEGKILALDLREERLQLQLLANSSPRPIIRHPQSPSDAVAAGAKAKGASGEGSEVEPDVDAKKSFDFEATKNYIYKLMLDTIDPNVPVVVAPGPKPPPSVQASTLAAMGIAAPAGLKFKDNIDLDQMMEKVKSKFPTLAGLLDDARDKGVEESKLQMLRQKEKHDERIAREAAALRAAAAIRPMQGQILNVHSEQVNAYVDKGLGNGTGTVTSTVTTVTTMTRGQILPGIVLDITEELLRSTSMHEPRDPLEHRRSNDVVKVIGESRDIRDTNAGINDIIQEAKRLGVSDASRKAAEAKGLDSFMRVVGDLAKLMAGVDVTGADSLLAATAVLRPHAKDACQVCNKTTLARAQCTLENGMVPHENCRSKLPDSPLVCQSCVGGPDQETLLKEHGWMSCSVCSDAQCSTCSLVGNDAGAYQYATMRNCKSCQKLHCAENANRTEDECVVYCEWGHEKPNTCTLDDGTDFPGVCKPCAQKLFHSCENCLADLENNKPPKDDEFFAAGCSGCVKSLASPTMKCCGASKMQLRTLVVSDKVFLCPTCKSLRHERMACFALSPPRWSHLPSCCA